MFQLKENQKHIVSLSGQGCAGCITMYQTVKNFIQKYPQVSCENIELDQSNQTIVEEYEISKVPSVLLFDGHTLVAKIQGFQPDEIFEYYAVEKLKI